QIVPESAGFDPDEIFALLQRYRGVSMFAAPTVVKRMVDAAATSAPDTQGLKTVVDGGGPMYLADLEAAIATFGNKFAQIYGQGESPMTITAMPKWMHVQTDRPRHAQRLASVGIAQSMLQVRIVDDNNQPLGADEA